MIVYFGGVEVCTKEQNIMSLTILIDYNTEMNDRFDKIFQFLFRFTSG